MKSPKNKFLILDLEEMKIFAQNLMKIVTFPIVIQLFGDLGVGKTQFTKYCAQALGIKETINSPSFIKMNRYSFAKNSFFTHLDGYHLEEKMAKSFVDYFDDDLIIIEWPQPFVKIFANTTLLKIYFEHHNEKQRKISIDASEKIYQKIFNIFDV